jgi:hypothetical protein
VAMSVPRSYAWLETFFADECDPQVHNVRFLPNFIDLDDLTAECAAAWRLAVMPGKPPSRDLIRKVGGACVLMAQPSRCPASVFACVTRFRILLFHFRCPLALQVFRLNFPNVRQPIESDHGICHECLILRIRRHEGVSTTADKEILVRNMLEHRVLHKSERKAMTLRQLTTQLNPHLYCMFFIDLTRKSTWPHRRVCIPSHSLARDHSVCVFAWAGHERQRMARLQTGRLHLHLQWQADHLWCLSWGQEGRELDLHRALRPDLRAQDFWPRWSGCADHVPAGGRRL